MVPRDLHCIVVEDAPSGARAARAAGMRCTGTGPALAGPAHADLVNWQLSTLTELPAVLQQTHETQTANCLG